MLVLNQPVPHYTDAPWVTILTPHFGPKAEGQNVVQKFPLK
jgi:hypothetical protein